MNPLKANIRIGYMSLNGKARTLILGQPEKTKLSMVMESCAPGLTSWNFFYFFPF